VPIRRGSRSIMGVGSLRGGAELVVGVLAASLCWAAGAHAETPVPPNLQVAILARVLAYDRAFKTRAGSAGTIGVVAKAGDKASAGNQAEMVKAFKALDPPSIQGVPVAVAEHSFTDAAALSEWIDSNKVGVLYLASGLAAQLDEIALVCAKKRLI